MSTPETPSTAKAEASVVPSIKGLPWWAAVLVGLIPVIVGTFIDVASAAKPLGDATLSGGFRVLSVVGCVLAALVVRRRAIFTAMVQPPLVIMAGVTLALLISPDTNLSLISSASIYVATFPTMVTATAAAVVIGAARFFLQPLRTAKPRPAQHV